MGYPPTPQPNYQTGIFSKIFVWLFGSHWAQQFQSFCGWVQFAIGLIAGGALLSASQIDALNVPWLGKHWITIVAWSTMINNLVSLISKRTNQAR